MGLVTTLKFIVNHPLSSGSRIQSIMRFLKWQVGSRLVEGAVAMNFVDQTRLLVSRGMTGATQNIYCGLQEFEDMAFVLHVLRDKDLFVDIGANVGSYTVLASGAVGARCISIEPIPDAFHHLMDNINLNRIGDRVSALNIGIGKGTGILRFTSDLDTVNHVLADSEEEIGSIEVPVRRLDEVLVDFEPVLMKIDVEGFETNVIVGADKALTRESLLGVIMELNGSSARYGFDENRLHRTMLEYGFRTFTYLPFEKKLVALDDKNAQSGNTLYVRNEPEVSSRLRNARKFMTNLGIAI